MGMFLELPRREPERRDTGRVRDREREGERVGSQSPEIRRQRGRTLGDRRGEGSAKR